MRDVNKFINLLDKTTNAAARLAEERNKSLLKIHFQRIFLRHGCSPLNLLHIFRTAFRKNIMEGCFWQYNQHLPIRIQQEIQEREVKLASSKQKNKKR